MYFRWLIYYHQDGDTALREAAYEGHTEIVKFLLDAGADVEAKCIASKRISIFSCVCVCVCGLGEAISLHTVP